MERVAVTTTQEVLCVIAIVATILTLMLPLFAKVGIYRNVAHNWIIKTTFFVMFSNLLQNLSTEEKSKLLSKITIEHS